MQGDDREERTNNGRTGREGGADPSCGDRRWHSSASWARVGGWWWVGWVGGWIGVWGKEGLHLLHQICCILIVSDYGI